MKEKETKTENANTPTQETAPLTEAIKGITETQADIVLKKMDEQKTVTPIVRKEVEVSLSNEERIEAFIKDKKDYIKLNDFLKSLYPIPKFNEPPVYSDKGEMKRLRVLLDNMQSHGKLQIKNNGHSKLGSHYYEGEQQYARFYHIGNLTIEAKK